MPDFGTLSSELESYTSYLFLCAKQSEFIMPERAIDTIYTPVAMVSGSGCIFGYTCKNSIKFLHRFTITYIYDLKLKNTA